MKQTLAYIAALALFAAPLGAQAAATYTCSNTALAPITVNDPSGADGTAVSDFITKCSNAGGTASGPSAQQLSAQNNGNQPAYNAAPTPAPAGKAPLQYTPLEPLPGGSPQSYNSLSGYLALMFNILLSLGAMIAVVTLVLAGITYMVSEVVDKKSEARARMRASIIGLLLLLSCWLILNTINPNLVKFNLPIPGASSTVAGGGAGTTAQPPPTQAQAAQGEAACKANGPYCAYNPSPNGGFSCDCVGV